MKCVVRLCTFLNVLTSLHGVFGGHINCKEQKEYRLIQSDIVATADSVIATHKVSSNGECCLHCDENQKCKSYNYQYKGNEGQRLCELNNVTLEACPIKRLQKKGHSYYRQTNLNSSKLQAYGSKENPGRSCNEIQQCRDSDGEYWIQYNETLLLKVFCYLTTKDASTSINVARNKPTDESSTLKSGRPSGLAVDGNRDGDITRGSCTHTQSQLSPWWRVDLQHVYFVRYLIIANRINNCCYLWLSNFEIRIGLSLANNGNSNPTCGGKHSFLSKKPKRFVCPSPMIGRFVNILMPNVTKAINLCEVEVYH